MSENEQPAVPINDILAPDGENWRTRPRQNRRRINAAILANSLKPDELQLTASQIALELGVQTQAVYDQTNRLRQRGILKGRVGQSVKTGSPKGINRSVTEALNGDEMLEAIARGEIPDKDECRRVLATIIATGTVEQKMKAVKDLRTIDGETDVQLGPPPPETADRAVARLRRIHEAAPEEVLVEALSYVPLEIINKAMELCRARLPELAQATG